MDYTIWGHRELVEEISKKNRQLEKILNLLVDKNIGTLTASKQLTTKDEEFGALVFAGWAFRSACDILGSK